MVINRLITTNLTAIATFENDQRKRKDIKNIYAKISDLTILLPTDVIDKSRVIQ